MRHKKRALAEACRARKMAVAIHTDRAAILTRGTPEGVRAMARLENERFRPREHGGWFCVEVDNRFPCENVVTLVEEIYSLRHCYSEMWGIGKFPGEIMLKNDTKS